MKRPIKRQVSVLALQKLESELENNPPKDFNYKIENFYVILDWFYRLPTFNRELKAEDDGYIEISSTYMRSYITNDYKQYVGYLIWHDIIQTDGDYEIGEKCLGYRLNPEFIGELQEVLIPVNCALWKRIKNNFNEKHKKIEPHILLMKKHFKKIEFDFELAYDYLKCQLDNGKIRLYQYCIMKSGLNAMENKEFYFKRNNTNHRIDSNFTNQTKMLMNCLLGDFIQKDLICSQPYLFNLILKRAIQPNISFSGVNAIQKLLNSIMDGLFQGVKIPPLCPKEVALYNKETREGKIYELFMERFKITRDEAKKMFLGILYSKNDFSNFESQKKYFQLMFPSIFKLIYQLKILKSNKFAIALQNIESVIFIDVIAKRLVEAGIIPYTKNDSVIIERKDEEQALQIMEDAFREIFGEVPSIKPDELHPDKLLEEMKPIRHVLFEKFQPFKKADPNKKKRKKVKKRNWTSGMQAMANKF